jgi:hypothetical protein
LKSGDARPDCVTASVAIAGLPPIDGRRPLCFRGLVFAARETASISARAPGPLRDTQERAYFPGSSLACAFLERLAPAAGLRRRSLDEGCARRRSTSARRFERRALAMAGGVGHMSRRAVWCGRRGREAEGGGLLNRYRVVKLYRGFESLRLRHRVNLKSCNHWRIVRAA